MCGLVADFVPLVLKSPRHVDRSSTLLHPNMKSFGAYRRWLPKLRAGGTRGRFANRMAKVQAYMNSAEFQARDGGGLASLTESLRERCRRVVELDGERLRT